MKSPPAGVNRPKESAEGLAEQQRRRPRDRASAEQSATSTAEPPRSQLGLRMGPEGLLRVDLLRVQPQS